MANYKDYTGRRFGKLTVLEKAYDSAEGIPRWKCICDCGNEIIAPHGGLKNGTITSCGCVPHKIALQKKDNLLGKKFGRLLALELSNNTTSNKNRLWKCQCNCGNIVEVTTYKLKHGIVKSCGCLMKERQIEANTIHGGSGTRLYEIWTGMKRRCLNPKNHAYASYGGRGIKVCEEWDTNFATFRDWALNNGYADNLSLDRIDVNGNYEPSNCRWASAVTQANNRRSNHLITCDGETHTMSEWSEITGIKVATIFERLKHNWDIHDALYKKPRF